MYLVAIAWAYVTVMMAIAEAASPGGTLLGAFFTLLLYGVLPLSIVLYILGTPARKRRIKARQQTPADSGSVQAASNASVAPDAGGQTPAAAQPPGVAPVREEA
ncbi:hypothetical protein [Comamonas guangdongensis]|uniref:Transmembrane protein n=1 Tax=Comamonas guangdongensis TaxID=510515 RepID=A0ABV3ZTG6_9BURK